jgi:hypothetical protein
MLTGHSGGGSFILGYLDAAKKIPSLVERIAFLEANYGYENGQHRGEMNGLLEVPTVYVDYSHGVRLFDQWCEVDGKPMQINDVLRDKTLCELLSDEGPLESTSYRRPTKQ